MTIDKVKAEIERLKEIGCPLQKGSDYQHGYDEFYTQIKTFINSLPAEHPSGEFKGEFDDYLVHGDIRNPNFDGPFGYDDIRKTAIHFANWQKEQLMKNVVETKVKSRIDGKGIFIDIDIPIGIDVNEDDKVKIIIIKEDEE